jgi:hypothetical protein
MAGNSGKMTREAIAKRGPRMRLLKVYTYTGVRPLVFVGLVIMRDPHSPVGLFKGAAHTGYTYRTLAQSYSLAYLLRIGRVNQEVA